jgi:transposase-like protein
MKNQEPNKAIFLYEDAAREYLEQLRWPNGAVCPHCKRTGAYKLQPKAESKSPVRKGVWKCKFCRRQFTVTVGTIFEDSHIPLYQWLSAIQFFCSSKKGISAHQLHRMLHITYKSAWFMAHRIRYAMRQMPLAPKLQGIIEADETYIGGKAHGRRGRGADNKIPVVALVQRNGEVRSFKTKQVTTKNLRAIIRQHVTKDSTIMTDEFPGYKGLDKEFAGHQTINHRAKEYVRGNAHVNTAEGYFSILKRGIIGTYHHISEQHLDRYLDEFNFRYSSRKVDDAFRMILAIEGVKGKRLVLK